MQKVFFHSGDRSLTLKKRTGLKDFIEALFKKEKKMLRRIDYIFCSDNYLLEINKQHLEHNYYTDIITFELSEDENTEAEVYISVDRVKDNARDLKITISEEILRVIFHGALHLCGYKDKSTKDEQLMRKMEDKYIQQFSLLN